jgi:DNA polymerase/3'-5' exonuclease PolX
MRHGLSDRIPRPIIPGDKHALNKRIAERLANHAYSIEIDAGPANSVWVYRKAAWAIEELEQDIGLVYRTMGLRGVQAIPGVDPILAVEIAAWLSSGSASGTAAGAPVPG